MGGGLWSLCNTHRHWGAHSAEQHDGRDRGERLKRDRDRGPRSGATVVAAASTDFDLGTDAAMFVTVGETKPTPSDKPFLFFHDPRSGDMRSAGQHGNIVATVATTLNEASGAPPIAADATRVLVDTGSQATCMRKFAPFGVAQMTPPTGAFGLPFALLDGGNGNHVVEHGDTLNIATVECGIPITFAEAAFAPSFGFDILSAGAMEDSGATTIAGTNTRLVKDNTCIDPSKFHELFYLGVLAGLFPGGIDAALSATRRRRRIPELEVIPELEATTAPAHDVPTLPLHDITISKTETRLHRHTLANQVHNPNAESWTPTVPYIGLFADGGLMSSAVEAHGGEIAMLIEKELIA